jgi:hypothetical protein
MIQIRVERQKGYFGVIRALEIIVDGTSLGRINQGQTLIFDAPDGVREIWGKMDWGKTRRLDIANYNLDKTVVFKGLFTVNLFRSLGLLDIPFSVHLRAAHREEIGGEQSAAPNRMG